MALPRDYRLSHTIATTGVVKGVSKNNLTVFNEKQQKEQSQNTAINVVSQFKKILGQEPVTNNIVSYFVEKKETKNDVAQENIEDPIIRAARLKSAVAFIQASQPNPLTDLFKQKVLEVELKKQAKELCQAVVYGDYDKVKAMLDKNPYLVFYEAQVQDYSFYEEEEEVDEKDQKKRIYRKLEGTALQLALGAEDVSQKDHPDEGIADLIKRYFIKACKMDEKKANEAIIKQFKEQFPEAEFPEFYEADEKKREEIIKIKNTKISDIKVVEDIGKVIQDSKANTKAELDQDKTLQDALKAFRNYFKPKGVITKGKHFTIQILIKAFELYHQKFDMMGGTWGAPKNLFFRKKIIGYIQRFLPACYAQAFCQGLFYVIDYHKKLERSLKIDISRFFYPLDIEPYFRLGYEYDISRCAGSLDTRASCWMRRMRTGCALQDLYRIKAFHLWCFIRQPDNCKKTACVIM